MDTGKFLKLRAMAKINLGLDVIGSRPDGYHNLRMIMQTVKLHDRVFLRKTRAAGIRVKSNLAFLPGGENNLAGKAARLLIDEFGMQDGVYIDIDKHIPVAAGLAGGSTDAAAVLIGMNRLFALGLTEKELMERGVKIGADVPYCILRGTALAEGIGDVLTPLPDMPPCTILLAKPGVHVSTKFVYRNLKLDENTVHPDIDGQIKAIREGNLQQTAQMMGNVLETVTVPAFPQIARIMEIMQEQGALGTRMSGSGPTVFGIFDSKEKAKAAYSRLRRTEAARQVILTEPYAPKNT